MTYWHAIYPLHNVIVANQEGPFSSQDVLSAILAVVNDAEYRQGMNCVTDISRVDLQFGYAEMQGLVRSLKQEPNIKFGLLAVVAAEPVQRGIARMFDSLATELQMYTEFEMFSDMLDASKWLKIPPNLSE